MKVMVTGKNRRIALNVSEHLEVDRGYEVVKCAAKKDTLYRSIPFELPQVIIICLGDEDQDSVKIYDVLSDCVDGDWISIIVIANDEDSKVFMNNTGLEKMTFISRPVSLIALYTKLTEIEEKLDSEFVNGRSQITEYVNPNAEKKQYIRKHILVVDDDSEQLMQIKEHLSEFYDVTAVRSGKAAFKYLEKHEVDLILLDYIMPEMDGPEVYTRIRESVDFSWIPVIFLTGIKEKNKVVKTLVELKPQGYLVKPAKKSEIVAKIIDVLG